MIAAPVRAGSRRCECGSADVAAGGECDACSRHHPGGLQRAGAHSAWLGPVPPIVHEVLSSPGQPLDAETRSCIEPRFGHDFTRVRVHVDARAAESARAVNALAYTVGRDVVFGRGQFSPASAAGRSLIAHELAHVVQQEGAPAGSGPEGLHVDSPSAAPEREAAAAADALAFSAPVAAPVTSRTPRQVSPQLDPMARRPSPPPAPRRRPGAPLPYREATELTECLRIMGAANMAYCQAVLGEAPSPSPRATLRIERQGGDDHSFISTDRITLTSSAGPADWTVHGVSTNAGDGNPHQAANRPQFTFRPDPTGRARTGSRTPNDPIAYRVEANAGGQTGTFDLVQDEADIIRQEYVDLGPAVPPDRSRVVAPTIPTYNTGNYSLIVDGGMDNALTGTEREFQALTPAGTAAPAIGVSSGYRNPRRNVAVGSQFPVTSRHVLGTALDLVVPGANATLWTRLRAAGANAGNGSICEDGPTQVPCNAPNVDHVHIQW